VQLTFRTNEAEPVEPEFTVENGKAAPMFDAHEGFWVEVTPTLYQDGWANLAYRYYEERNGKRRALPGGGSLGMQAVANGAVPSPGRGGGGGGGSTMVSGTKVYSVRMSVRISAAP
jgi:hypothetical protein